MPRAGPDLASLRGNLIRLLGLQAFVLLGVLFTLLLLQGTGGAGTSAFVLGWAALLPVSISAAGLLYYRRVMAAVRGGDYTVEFDRALTQRTYRILGIAGLVWAVGLGAALLLP